MYCNKSYEKVLEGLNIKEEDGGEYYVGKVKNIIQLYLYLIGYEIEVDRKDNLEDFVCDIEQINDFIKELMELNEETEIKTFYNAMGCYSYEKVEN